MKDWKGNKRSTHATLGSSNHVEHDREDNDYYATDPKAVDYLLDNETFSAMILEPACGQGHISKALEDAGYNITSTDLVNRGYGEQQDFLNRAKKWDGDVITNPPYSCAQEFVEHSIYLTNRGSKIAMFLKIQWLEGKRRKKFFAVHPPKTIYVSSSRITCAKNGDFDASKHSNAVAYAWYVWENGFTGDPIIKWIN